MAEAAAEARIATVAKAETSTLFIFFSWLLKSTEGQSRESNVGGDSEDDGRESLTLRARRQAVHH